MSISPNRKKTVHDIYVFTVILATFLLTNFAFSQGKKPSKDNLEITIDCIEYAGNGKFTANFGYELNGKGFEIPETDSRIKFDNGKPGKSGLNKFERGKHSGAWTEEFDTKDRVTWELVLPNGTTKIISANINSSHCSDEDSGLIPLFNGNEEGGVIWPELFYLAEEYAQNGSTGSDVIFQVADESIPNEAKVLVEIFAFEAIDDILATNFDFVDYLDPFTYIGYYPITALQTLNNYPERINFVRPVYPPFSNVGNVTTEGDLAQGTAFIRDAYPLDGSGIKIGVLSDSYNRNGLNEASSNVSVGDLPGANNPFGNIQEVEVLNDGLIKGFDEGRAMLQIIHDVAPGAELAFRTGFYNAVDFAQGITELDQLAGCDVIVDDITYITEPFYRDGKVAEAVDEVTDRGVIYVTSAGNFSNASSEGNWSGSTQTQPYGFLRNPGDQVHDFGGGDVLQRISLEPVTNADSTTSPATILMVLQWDDEFFSLSDQATTNLDIWIVDDFGNLLYSGNRDNIGEDPVEVLAFQVTKPLIANVMISGSSYDFNSNTNVPVSANLPWKYIVYRSRGLGFLDTGSTDKSTITGHANSESAITVGATRYDNIEQLEPFSSIGGTEVRDNGILITRQKPDIAGPDGVSTTVFDLQQFFGTSAAAPHVAGGIALLYEAKNQFYGAPLNTGEVKQLFQSPGVTLDLGIPGYDFGSGFGYLQVDKAIATMAEPTPKLLELLALQPGTNEEATPETAATEGIELVLVGQYVSEDAQILYNGEPLTNVQTSIDESDETITRFIIQVSPFIGKPEITVLNPSIGDGDGGPSNVLYIFGDQPVITVKITPVAPLAGASKKFGERLALEDYSYETDVSLPFTLPHLSYTSTAGSLSLVGNSYSVSPESFILNEGESLEEAINRLNGGNFDASTFGELYALQFESIPFSIEQLPLTIKAKDAAVSYGSSFSDPNISVIDFEFIIPPEYLQNIPDVPAFIDLIRSQYESIYFNHDPDEIYGIINRTRAISNRTRAISNGEPPLTLLESKSFLVTEASVSDPDSQTANRTRAISNGDFVVDLDEEHIFNFFDPDAGLLMLDEAEVEDYTPNRTRAISNAGDIFVNGTPLKIENRTRAISNGTPLTNSSENNFYYDEIVLIVDDEEAIEGVDDDGNDLAPVQSFYAIALVTGVSVTEPGKEHFIIPGSFIDNDFTDNVDFTRNFILETQPGLLSVTPVELQPVVSLLDSIGNPASGTILFGDDLPLFVSGYEFFQLDDNEENVFESVRYFLDNTDTPEVEHLDFYEGTGTYKVLAVYDFFPEDPVNYVLLPANEPLLIVEAAPVEILFDENSLSQIFGNTDDVIVITNARGQEIEISVTITYNGGQDFPTDAGTYEVIVTSADPNYIGSAITTLIIEPAPAQITLQNLMQTYDGDVKQVSTSISVLGAVRNDLNLIITFDGGPALPVNAEKYLVEATLDENNFAGTVSDTLVILKAGADITFEHVELIYNGTQQTIDAVATGLGDVQMVNFNITYKQGGVETDPVNAGIYDVEAFIRDQNFEGSGETQMEINKAVLLVTADDQITNQGTLPEFSGTIEGFVADEDVESVFGDQQVVYSLEASITSPGFFPNAISPFIEEPDNYTLRFARGDLYVNPFGPGTKKIQVYLDCVETTNDPDSPFLANFEYRNRNDHPVYIPFTGSDPSDNYVSTEGTFQLVTGEVFAFMPEGGTFRILFDGNPVRWIVSSWENEENNEQGGAHKTATAGEASSNSSRCSGEYEAPILGYPNPVSSVFFIELGNVTVSEENISIVDAYGQSYMINLTINQEIGGIELDMNNYPVGFYVIRIFNNEIDEVFNVLKE